jgi:hypothetical protein
MTLIAVVGFWPKLRIVSAISLLGVMIQLLSYAVVSPKIRIVFLKAPVHCADRMRKS